MSLLSKFAAYLAQKATPTTADQSTKGLPVTPITALTSDQKMQLDLMLDDDARPQDISAALQLHPTTVYQYKRYHWKPARIKDRAIAAADPVLAEKQAKLEHIKLDRQIADMEAESAAKAKTRELEQKKLELQIQEQELKIQAKKDELEFVDEDDEDDQEQPNPDQQLIMLLSNLMLKGQAGGGRAHAQQGNEWPVLPGQQSAPPVSPAPPATPPQMPPKRAADDEVTDDQIREVVRTQIPKPLLARMKSMDQKELREFIVQHQPVSEKIAERAAIIIKGEA